MIWTEGGFDFREAGINAMENVGLIRVELLSTLRESWFGFGGIGFDFGGVEIRFGA